MDKDESTVEPDSVTQHPSLDRVPLNADLRAMRKNELACTPCDGDTGRATRDGDLTRGSRDIDLERLLYDPEYRQTVREALNPGE